MNFLNAFRISTRLAASFAAVLLLMGAGSAAGIWHINRIEQIVDQLAQDETRKLTLAEGWLRGISVNLVRAKTTLLVTDEDDLLAQFKIEMDATSADISAVEKQLDALVSAEQGRRILGRIGAQREKYRAIRGDLIARRARNEDVRVDLTAQMNPLAQAYLSTVNDFVEWQRAQVEAARVNATAAAHSARSQIVAATVGGLLAALAIAVLLARSIVVPLRQARDSALRIAAGNLNIAVHAAGRDEAAEMLQALGDMQDSLRGIVSEVRTGSSSVSEASTQIASGNADLSSRTEEQASSIEETAASIEELTSTVNQNAESSRKAEELATAASETANRGGDVVSRVVKTMDQIQGSSKKISEIIGVIDGIAFQTNILALNAAVEAARAGDQGRGFAVVASEVRSLAQRSASAAKEIKGLITDSVETVEGGSRLVNEAGATMQEVVKSVKRVSDIIGEIATATTEQSAGISQVNTAVTELDRVTQQNAALVEESAAASESLRQQAERLAATVSVFQIDERVFQSLGKPERPAAVTGPRPAKALRSPARAAHAPRLAPAQLTDGAVDAAA